MRNNRFRRNFRKHLILKHLRRRQRKKYINAKRLSHRARLEIADIYMPRVLSIYNKAHRERTLESLLKFRELIIKNKHDRIVFDFREVRFVFADAVLLLYSEIDRILESGLFKGKMRFKLPTIDHSDKDLENISKVRQVLKHVGLLDLVGQNLKIATKRQDVVHWRVAKGKKSEGSKTESILEVVDKHLGGKVSRRFYTGMTEAMTNTHHHAYEEDRLDGLGINIGGWWMFMQHLENKLSIIICDLGMGIPRSLPRTHSQLWVELLKKFIDIDDGLSIDFAVQAGSTSTELSNRGKGLKKMVGIVDDIPNSSLIIYSNRGVYVKNRTVSVMHADYRDSILGTLISWTVEIPEGQVPA